MIVDISSLVVDVQPAALPAVLQALRGIEGLEVHACTPQGKVVLTVECPCGSPGSPDARSADAFERVSALDGVMSVALAYHHIEHEPDLEVPDDADAT